MPHATTQRSALTHSLAQAVGRLSNRVITQIDAQVVRRSVKIKDEEARQALPRAEMQKLPDARLRLETLRQLLREWMGVEPTRAASAAPLNDFEDRGAHQDSSTPTLRAQHTPFGAWRQLGGEPSV